MEVNKNDYRGNVANVGGGADADQHFATIVNQEPGSMVQMGHHYRE